MSSSIIVLDSSDDETDTPNLSSKPPTKKLKPPLSAPPAALPTKPPLPAVATLLKRPHPAAPENPKDRPAVKRLKPTQLSATVDKSKWLVDDVCATSEPIEIPDSQPTATAVLNSPSSSTSGVSEKRDEDAAEREPLEPDYEKLLQACREADPSADMERLIKIKLINYYYSVHPDFVKSKNFRKTVRLVTEEIRKEPAYVYAKVKTVVEELKVRKKSKAIVMSNEDATSTGDVKKDGQIKKLNKALYILKRKIQKLEEDEVDWNEDDEDSSYLQLERFKKRACEIYEKICDLTGESKHAHRSTKKPISFNGTCYPQFNRTVQAFVNRNNLFPDFVDVLKCLEYCNKVHSFDLRTDEMKKIAQDAFIKIGKLLQNRRKTDLYETVSHFTLDSADPALSDPTLSAKLNENIKFHKSIGSIIDKFAQEQDLASETLKKQRQANQETPENGSDAEDEPPSSPSDIQPVDNNNKADDENLKKSREEPHAEGRPEKVKPNGRILEPILQIDDDLKINSVGSLPAELFQTQAPGRMEIIISDDEDGHS